MDREIKYDGILHIGDIEIPCYVLSDGTRILSERKTQEALKIVDNNVSGTKLPDFLANSAIKPFIFNEKDPAHFEPIYSYKGKQLIKGYEATLLPDICEGLLSARRAGIKLTKRQAIVAERCEILLAAFAKVGIIALVDEATGYQYDREREELQHILKAYISEELLPWQKRFPDIFYKELFRLNGWDYTVKGIKKRPGIIGRWTNLLVYNQLPIGVLDELKKKTPRSKSGNRTARYHQSLTLDIGEPNLANAINQAITICMVSSSMKEMWYNFNKLKERQQGQLELPFMIEFDEKGHLKEESNTIQDEKTTDFDNSLKKALYFNPNKEKESPK